MLPYATQAADLVASHPSHAIVQAAPLTQAEFFLGEVWGALPADPAGQSVVGLTVDALRRGRKQMTTAWQFSADRMDKIPDMLTWANRYNVDPTHAEMEFGSVWWMGASRKSEILYREYARGGANDLQYIGAMWADLDCANAGVPLTKAFDAVLNMPIKPSLIIFSGGGLQVVHLLASAWNVSTIEAAQQYKMISRAFYEPLYRVSGTETDTRIHNADRMMRVPGFINRKKAREGARASLLWVNECRYSTETIREASAPYLPAPRAPLGTRPERDDLDPDNYAVSQNFIAYIVQGAVVPEGHRHATLLSLAMDAARAGISRATAQRLFESKAAHWYRGEDFKQELYDILEWAYERATYEEAVPLLEGDTDDVPYIGSTPAEWLVKIEPPKADEPAEPRITLISDDDEATRRAGERIIEIPFKPSHIEKMSVQALRAEQEQVIAGYLNRDVSMASVLRLKTPPGAGKTHAAIHATVAWALRSLENAEEDEAPTDGAIIATLFKMNRAEGLAWARGFGIDPLIHPRLFYFFIGRTDDQNSKGYCARHAIAEAVAAKGRNVITSVCDRCPVRTACEERFYLSQFDEAEQHGIIVLRAQHLYMSELLSKRKLLLIDESPFHVVSAGLKIKINEMNLSALPPSSQDQWPDEVGLLDLFLSYLREIMASNRAADVNDSHIRFGGRWLFERLVEKLGSSKLEAVFALDGERLNDLSKVTIFGDMTLQAASDLPVHFLPTLIKLLSAEYKTFQNGATEWNSRIIPHGQELHLYPMEPFSFGTHTRVIVTDATDPDEFYTKAFADSRGRPRQIIPYERALHPKGRATVYIGTENSKTTLLETANGLMDKIDLKKWFGKRKQYSYSDTVELSELVRNAGNPALAQAMLLIHSLAERHNGSLLVVLYKKLFEAEKENAETFLKAWVTRSGVLSPSLVQWFGNLRGKNDYKHLNAVLAIGTPRLRESDLRIQSQIWSHRDSVPVSFEREILTEPYAGFIDTKGMGRAYRYVGYKDPRVNRLYLNSMQSELRQCYERIRKNSSDAEKYVYLATAFPAADQVDEFLVYQNVHVDSVASLVLQKLFDATQAEGAPQRLQPYLDELAKLAGVSTSTARRAYDRVRESGVDPRDGEKWSEKLDAYEGLKRLEAIILKWVKTNPDRIHLSSRQILKMMTAENIPVGLTSIVEFLDKYRKN